MSMLWTPQSQRYHILCVTCIFSSFLFQKSSELVGGGSVINGATPFSLEYFSLAQHINTFFFYYCSFFSNCHSLGGLLHSMGVGTKQKYPSKDYWSFIINSKSNIIIVLQAFDFTNMFYKFLQERGLLIKSLCSFRIFVVIYLFVIKYF